MARSTNKVNIAGTEYCTTYYTPNHTVSQCRVDVVRHSDRLEINYELLPIIVKEFILYHTYWIHMGFLLLYNAV